MSEEDIQSYRKKHIKRDIPFTGMSLLRVTVLIRTGSK